MTAASVSKLLLAGIDTEQRQYNVFEQDRLPVLSVCIMNKAKKEVAWRYLQNTDWGPLQIEKICQISGVIPILLPT